MNFTKYFKRNDYDNMDRFMLHQKIRCSRDPFEGDPFKIQSLNFRYAEKPKFYPTTNRNAENSQMRNLYRKQPHNHTFEREIPSSFMNFGRKSSSVCSFSVTPKAEKLVAYSIVNSSENKFDVNRSKSFIQPFISVPVTGESTTSNHQNLVKPKNSLESKRRTDSMTAINLDHSGGCKISIKINGVPKDQVHIKKRVNNREISQTRTKTITKSSSPKIEQPYKLKPSRSYVIHRDDTSSDISSDLRKSSRKLFRESSTHSMIPHKEERTKSREFDKKFSLAVTRNSSCKARGTSQLNLSNKGSGNGAMESLSKKKSSVQKTIPGTNLERRAFILEKILSSNPIVTQSKQSLNLKKSKSVINQRFTPLPISRKYCTVENINPRVH
ncbi:uncharacterized protein LOC129907153 [Episyrphus balteatus]|uniref:uncharacterized protein LOC129907153 n=1 Tax=Episyrphus balteatus TaxID=286459 RepID=UPI0024854A49|nr:uncharacterized protein LOC129907153 [Episyrphus balteatus]